MAILSLLPSSSSSIARLKFSVEVNARANGRFGETSHLMRPRSHLPSFCYLRGNHVLGVKGLSCGAVFSSRLSSDLFAVRNPRVLCQASEKEKIAGARKNQMQATELFAELLKANDVKAVAREHVESLSEEFFMIASTYVDLAKKEGNVEVVNKLETTLQSALSVKESTLRPEIRLLNQLLRQEEKGRAKIIQDNVQYLGPDSYFFQLLGRMIGDVEKQTNNPRRLQLLAQLRTISKETKEVSKTAKKSKGFGGR